MSIAKQHTDNFGGLSRLYITLAINAADLFDFNLEDLTLSEAQLATNFDRIHFLRETGNYDDAPADDPQGTIYTHTIECRVLKERDDVQANRKKYHNREVVALIYDFNGRIKLVGSAEQPLRYLLSTMTGKRVSDSNQGTILISNVCSEPARKVTITA